MDQGLVNLPTEMHLTEVPADRKKVLKLSSFEKRWILV